MVAEIALVLALAGTPAETVSAGDEFSATLQGLSLRPEGGTAVYGYALGGNAGVTSLGTRSLGAGRYLVQWNGRLEAILGIVAFEHPFFPIYGASLGGQGDVGLRLLPENLVSPYVTAGLSTSASAVTRSGVPFNGGTGANNLDGLGGVVGDVAIRAGAGGSLLDQARSLVGAAHLRLDLSSPGANVPGRVFFGGDLSTRYDLRGGLVAIGEIAYLAALPERDATLGLTSQINRWGLSASALKTLGDHFFLGLGVRMRRDQSTDTYAGGLTFVSAGPVDTRISITAGFTP